MAKRPFERRLGMLVDDYEDPPGNRVSMCLPGHMYGEQLSSEDREELLSRTAAGRTSSFDLQDEESPEYLDALLEGLSKFNIGAPMALVSFIDDPRVQPALIKATRDVSPKDLANFAQVVGMTGGEGARECLLERLSELVMWPETFKDDSFFNNLAGSLCSTAEALLRLDPDCSEAGTALLRLLQHPCGFNRRSAFSTVAELLRGGRAVRTEPFRRLSEALDGELKTEDDELFLHLCEYFYPRDSKVVEERLTALLNHEEYQTRFWALQRLTRLPYGHPGRALALIRDRLEIEPSVRLQVDIAKTLGPLAEAKAVRRVAVRALENESPTLRMGGASLLKWLDAEVASKVAEDAVRDEPDPVVRRRLEAWASPGDQHPDSPTAG